MKYNKNDFHIAKRPILFIANSSWYLAHYRLGLISECSKLNRVISISPIDSSTKILSNISLHIPWDIKRRNARSPIEFISASIKMYLILRLLKPKLIHFHTLKSNLIITLCSSLLRIPCVLSFAGLGNLNLGNKRILLKFILKVIYFIGTFERNSFIYFSKNHSRTKYIFQNPKDKRIFEDLCNPVNTDISLIPGSGIPNQLINFSKENLEGLDNNLQKKLDKKIIGCIYCGRLLKSKGIDIFINIAKIDQNRKYYVYGDIDESSSDSLTEKEVKDLKNLKNLKVKGFVSNPLLKFQRKPFVLIVPSIYGEGLPRAIAEALLLEIPVISSIQALSEVFTDKMIYVVNDRDPKSYLKAIDSIDKEIGLKNFYKKIKIGKNFVLNNMDEKKIVKETLKIYKMFQKDYKNIYLNDIYSLYSSDRLQK